MKSTARKIMIYAMAGILQAGFGTAVIEASPFQPYNPQPIEQLDDHHGHDGQRGHDNDRQREHDERLHKENERHEQEMRRHRGESEREWHERQERENRRHDDAMREIGAFLIGIAIGSSNN